MPEVFKDRLITQVMGTADAGGKPQADGPGIDWFTLKTELGPSRFGFDYERLEIVRMQRKGTVIDLARRASYGIHILTGSCLVAWRARDSPLSLFKPGKANPEPPGEFEQRIGKWKAVPAADGTEELVFESKPDDLSWARIPKGAKHEMIFGTAFEITLISESNEVILVVFSSDGPGNGSNTSPQPHSTS